MTPLSEGDADICSPHQASSLVGQCSWHSSKLRKTRTARWKMWQRIWWETKKPHPLWDAASQHSQHKHNIRPGQSATNQISRRTKVQSLKARPCLFRLRECLSLNGKRWPGRDWSAVAGKVYPPAVPPRLSIRWLSSFRHSRQTVSDKEHLSPGLASFWALTWTNKSSTLTTSILCLWSGTRTWTIININVMFQFQRYLKNAIG